MKKLLISQHERKLLASAGFISVQQGWSCERCLCPWLLQTEGPPWRWRTHLADASLIALAVWRHGLAIRRESSSAVRPLIKCDDLITASESQAFVTVVLCLQI